MPLSHMPHSLTSISILVLVFIGTFLSTFYYRRFALHHGILAKNTFRSLHNRTVSRGGGIVFACAFTATILIFWASGRFTTWQMLSFGVGGGSAAVIGLIDDVKEIRATRKLLAQSCLAVWVFSVFYKPLYEHHLNNYGDALHVLFALALLLIPIWFINLYNFIDGIDGMAISGAVYICIAAIIVLAMAGGNSDLIFIFSILVASGLGFLFFNLPPASVFMGDAGSIFLGYCLSASLLATILSGQISIWTWIVILGYFIGDTTITGIYRVLFVKKWYGVHRSHAYQNLARIYNNHAKVTYGVVLYNLLWSLPLAIWSARVPKMAPVAAILSLGPAVLWTLKFGPRLSSE